MQRHASTFMLPATGWTRQMDRQRAVRDKRYKYLRSWYPQQPGGADLALSQQYRHGARRCARMYDAGELNAVQRQWYEAARRGAVVRS